VDDQQLDTASAVIRFRQGESLCEALARVVTEQFDEALGIAGVADGDAAESVHVTRKAIKRLRAMLRLVRDSVPTDVYRTDNDVLGLVASELGWIRDVWVMAGTLDGLGLSDEEAAPAVATLRARLQARYEIERDAILGNAAHVASIVVQLEHVKKRSKVWMLEGGDPDKPLPHTFESIAPGLERVYRSGRKALRNAATSPTDTLLHAWRKRAKYLRHQVEALNILGPGELGEQEVQLATLTDQLGQDHDLAVLTHRLVRDTALVAGIDPNPVHGAIATERHRLQTAAFTGGASLYQTTPDVYIGKLAERWIEGPTF
jgi:CHAD domain-containing protein